MRQSAYEAHYRLYEHYSSLILRVRVSTVTVALVVVAYVLGISSEIQPPSGQLFGVDARAPVAALGSMFVALLYLMEVSYLKRLYQVVAGGRALESRVLDQPTYFTTYDPGESWPIHAVYAVAILILSAVATALAWERGLLLARAATALLGSAVPVALALGSFFRLRRLARIVDPARSEEPIAQAGDSD